MVASNSNNEMISGAEVSDTASRHARRMRETKQVAERHFERLFKKSISDYWCDAGLNFNKFEEELITPFQSLGEELPDTAVRVYGQEARDLIGKISEAEIVSLSLMKEEFRG